MMQAASLCKLLLSVVGSAATEAPWPPTVSVASSCESAATMPLAIRAILQENWTALDPEGAEIMAELSKVDVIAEFPHARSTFREHLEGTYAILGAWHQPLDVVRTGLVHTGYSGDLFRFFIWDAASPAERASLRAIIGLEA